MRRASPRHDQTEQLVERALLLVTTIELSPGQKERIEIREGDSLGVCFASLIFMESSCSRRGDFESLPYSVGSLLALASGLIIAFTRRLRKAGISRLQAVAEDFCSEHGLSGSVLQALSSHLKSSLEATLKKVSQLLPSSCQSFETVYRRLLRLHDMSSEFLDRWTDVLWIKIWPSKHTVVGVDNCEIFGQRYPPNANRYSRPLLLLSAGNIPCLILCLYDTPADLKEASGAYHICYSDHLLFKMPVNEHP